MLGYTGPDVDALRIITERAVEYIEAHAGEPFFVYGHEAYYYFLTGRYFPDWPFAQLYPGQTGADAGLELAAAVDRVSPARVIRGVVEWPGLPSIAGYAPDPRDPEKSSRYWFYPLKDKRLPSPDQVLVPFASMDIMAYSYSGRAALAKIGRELGVI